MAIGPGLYLGAAPAHAFRQSSAADAHSAQVVDAFGTVESKAPGNARATFRSVNVGDRLPEQSTLRTGDNGAALLQLPKGHLLRVGAGTVVILKQLDDNNQFSFKILSGQVWSLVRKVNHPARYDVETPSAVAGVTGTIFSVSADSVSGETLVSTEDGSVSVRAGQSQVAVTRGNYVACVAQPKGGPSPALHVRRQTPQLLQMWIALRRERVMTRKRDTSAQFNNAFPPRLQRDLDARFYEAWFGRAPGQTPRDSGAPERPGIRPYQDQRQGGRYRRARPESVRPGTEAVPAGRVGAVLPAPLAPN